MVDLTSQTLSVSFAEETDSNASIILEQPNDDEFILRCYPATGITFVASLGTVEIKETRLTSIKETLKFSNVSSIVLQKPNATEVNIDLDNFVVMREIKDIYGHRRIEHIDDIRLTFDENENAIIATDLLGNRVAIYGGCTVAYKSECVYLVYQPKTTAPFGGIYGFERSIGSVFAYNDTAVAVLDVSYNRKSSQEWVEFARVTSKIVLDARGMWEFPPGWQETYQSNRDKTPDNRANYPNPGSFPAPFTSTEYYLDPDQSFVDERVHCIIKVNTMGTLQYEDLNNGGDDYWAWYTPYFGYSTYDPIYELKYSEPPGGKKASSAKEFVQMLQSSKRTWRQVFLSVDKSAMLTRLQNDYPGVTVGRKG